MTSAAAKFRILVTVDGSNSGKAYLVCLATGYKTGGFPLSPSRFPTLIDKAAKAKSWALSRRNIDPATVIPSVEFKRVG